MKRKNSSAVISVWGITRENNLLWLYCQKKKQEIPDFVESIVKVNEIWKPSYNKIECNGVGIGVAQYVEAARLPVRKNYRKTDKLENSLSAQILCKAGRIYFCINQPFSDMVEDDVFSWSGLPSEEDDIIDTLADAANELSPSIAHEVSAPEVIRSRPTAVSTSSPHLSGIPNYGLPIFGFRGNF